MKVDFSFSRARLMTSAATGLVILLGAALEKPFEDRDSVCAATGP